MRTAPRKLLLVPIAAFSLLIPGAAVAGGGTSAADFLRRQFEYLAKGQYGRQWDSLHPAQQRFISRDDYMDCAQEEVGTLNLSRIKLTELESYREKIRIPGTTFEPGRPPSRFG